MSLAVDRFALRRDLHEIYAAAVKAVDPRVLVGRVLDGVDANSQEAAALFAKARRIFLLAAGKAALAMVRAVIERAGARLTAAMATIPADSTPMPTLAEGGVELFPAGHPEPDQGSVAAASRALEIAARAEIDDLIVLALSGGASAMLARPARGITLSDKIAVTRLLLRAGAPIRELNAVRKHISAIKGGGLLRESVRTQVLTLALSDVIGDDPSVIGSGPTVADPSTYGDAISILKRRGVWGRAPEAIRDRLERGNSGEFEETIKPGALELARAHYMVVGNNAVAIDAAATAAASLGYEVTRFNRLSGDADSAGVAFARTLTALPSGRRCLVGGGETTVVVRGDGRGGRAQQCGLAIAMELGRLATARPCAALVAGTDGIDGPTDAAGAVVDDTTVSRARALGIKPEKIILRNDSYSLFAALSDLVITGPTGTNVADLALGLIV